MMKAIGKLVFFLVLGSLLFVGCGEKDESLEVDVAFRDFGREVPQFSADSAFAFIEAQLDFGPRNPNSEGHRETAVFLEQKLRKYANNAVYVQRFTHEGYDETLLLKNIIAAFNPQATHRIMLCAHWDTRPRAEEDSDVNRQHKPIAGADDGASGVAVLLEIARIMSENGPPIGVDIVLFDGEDYGHASDLSNYFLGSRYWSANPPVPGYRPHFAVLLDMVGGKDAYFPREGYSVRYAPQVVDIVWKIAQEKGYDRFANERGMFVQDDHLILNEQYGLPTINIIHQRKDAMGNFGFPTWWHTHQDNIDIIDKQTLQEVGDVVLELIYNRIR
jgi:glutaminyl-peptide cyclotransferase